MQVVEQHVMRKSDPRYEVIDQAAFASKNLYNAALYEMRQAFIFQQVRFTYPEMHARMKSHDAYLRSLPKSPNRFFVSWTRIGKPGKRRRRHGTRTHPSS